MIHNHFTVIYDPENNRHIFPSLKKRFQDSLELDGADVASIKAKVIEQQVSQILEEEEIHQQKLEQYENRLYVMIEREIDPNSSFANENFKQLQDSLELDGADVASIKAKVIEQKRTEQNQHEVSP